MFDLEVCSHEYIELDKYDIELNLVHYKVVNGKMSSALSHIFRQPFAAGQVFSASMLNSLLYQVRITRFTYLLTYFLHLIFKWCVLWYCTITLWNPLLYYICLFFFLDKWTLSLGVCFFTDVCERIPHHSSQVVVGHWCRGELGPSLECKFEYVYIHSLSITLIFVLSTLMGQLDTNCFFLIAFFILTK